MKNVRKFFALFAGALLAISLSVTSVFAFNGVDTTVISIPDTTPGVTCDFSYVDKHTGIIYSPAQVEEMTDWGEIEPLQPKLTFTIPRNFAGKTVDINAGEAFNDAAEYVYHVKGGSMPFSVDIINLSNHTFSYRSGSFAVSTSDRTYYQGGSSDLIPGAAGFDGQQMFRLLAHHRAANTAVQALYGVDSPDKVTGTMLADQTLGNALNGYTFSGSTYTGITDLNKYFLDFYNAEYGTSYTALNQFGDQQITDGILGGIHADVYETNKELAELSYNFFYNHLLSIALTDSGMPKGDDYTIGTLMRNFNAGLSTPFEGSIAAAFGDIKSAGQDFSLAQWNQLSAGLNGTHTADLFQNYYFGATFGFSLDRTDIDAEAVTDTTQKPPVATPVKAVDSPYTGDSTPIGMYLITGGMLVAISTGMALKKQK